jgi:glycosyltransferase involved in cell wall biosynthesis
MSDSRSSQAAGQPQQDVAETPRSKISLIIPVFNEVDNLRELVRQIEGALSGNDYEVIFVDDGSADGSVELLRELVDDSSGNFCLVEFRRNFGQTAAIAAGIDHSSGDVIVLLDADLQNDPADIPGLVAKLEEGFDVVSGWRVDRKDAFLTRTLPSRVANWLISTVTGVRLHDYGCTLKAYRREVLREVRLYGEMHRFIPAYAGSVGSKITEMPVRHHPRRAGKTKYGLSRTFKVILDLATVKFLISYSHKPIYLFGGTGALLILPSLIMLGFLFFRRVFLGVSVLGSPIFQISTMLAILGFQSILMGFIAELLVRTYHESQAKPIYTVRRIYRK